MFHRHQMALTYFLPRHGIILDGEKLYIRAPRLICRALIAVEVKVKKSLCGYSMRQSHMTLEERAVSCIPYVTSTIREVSLHMFSWFGNTSTATLYETNVTALNQRSIQAQSSPAYSSSNRA